MHDMPTIEQAIILAETRALRVRLGSVLQHVPMRLDRYGIARPDRAALRPGSGDIQGRGAEEDADAAVNRGDTAQEAADMVEDPAGVAQGGASSAERPVPQLVEPHASP